MLFNLRKKYKHFQRYREISQVFLRNGLGFLLDRFDLRRFVPLEDRFSRDEKLEEPASLPPRLRRVMEDLGPTYVKLGQLLSTRPDILPPEYIKEFRRLQDEVPAVDFSQITTVLEDELGEDCLEEIFQEFSEEPTAAASIAQAHKARLKTGEPVIVKIQRPGIRKRVRVDLEIISDLAEIALNRGILPDFIDPIGLVEEFRETLFKELNFSQELTNIRRFNANHARYEDIVVPQVYEDYSSDRVLVMEEIQGQRLSKIEDFTEIENKKLSRLGAEVFLKQVMIDGFFHADPHPGNIFIIEGSRLAYVDFGMMGQISKVDRDYFALLFAALLRRNVEVIKDIIVEIGDLPRDFNERKLLIDIEEFIHSYYNRRLEDINFRVLFQDLQRIVFKHHIRLPQEFFLLFRALGLSEGVGSSLDPEFNIVEIGNDFLGDLLRDRLRPDNLLKRLGLNLWQFRNSIKDYPENFAQILEKLAQNELTLGFKHQNLENLINEIDFASNRLSISLIISSLIVGSSMIIQTGVQPLFRGIPLFGFLGFFMAGVLGIWLVISILRSGRF